MKFVHTLTEIGGGALTGCVLGALTFFASLWAIYQIPIASGPYPSLVLIFVASVAPAAIAGVVFWKTKMSMFSVAMIVASIVVVYWLWNYVLGLFGTYL